MPEKSSWDKANIRQKLGLVWRNRKKISQIIKEYFYLPFFLLIILWLGDKWRKYTVHYPRWSGPEGESGERSPIGSCPSARRLITGEAARWLW
jgi:hypothetical protein